MYAIALCGEREYTSLTQIPGMVYIFIKKPSKTKIDPEEKNNNNFCDL